MGAIGDVIYLLKDPQQALNLGLAGISYISMRYILTYKNSNPVMKGPFFIAFLFFPLIIIAQSEFEKGYFINNLGQKVEGFINNAHWTTHPKKDWIRTSV